MDISDHDVGCDKDLKQNRCKEEHNLRDGNMQAMLFCGGRTKKIWESARRRKKG